MTIAELLLTDLAWELPTTRKIIERAPADKYSWSPGSDLHTIAWNVNHLTDVAGWTPLILDTSELDLAPADGPKYAPSALQDGVLYGTRLLKIYFLLRWPQWRACCLQMPGWICFAAFHP